MNPGKYSVFQNQYAMYSVIYCKFYNTFLLCIQGQQVSSKPYYHATEQYVWPCIIIIKMFLVVVSMQPSTHCENEFIFRGFMSLLQKATALGFKLCESNVLHCPVAEHTVSCIFRLCSHFRFAYGRRDLNY